MRNTRSPSRVMLAPLVIAAVALLWPTVAVAERDCTAADIARLFTPCDAQTNKLTVVSYIRAGTVCDASRLVVPPPLFIDCYACGDGQQLDAMTLKCTSCPVGTFSSAMTRFSTFDPLPDELFTYCDPKPCAPWSVVEDTFGTVISSGLQPTENRPLTPWGTADESVQTLLSFTATVTGSSGVLRFDYAISSEQNYDGLVVRLNSTSATNPDTTIGKRSFFATGVHLEWHEASLSLPPGRTRVQFEYTKDSSGPVDGPELTGVNDRALLRNIEVNGTHKLVSDVQCLACPLGQWTGNGDNGGASECVRCPRNTFRGAAEFGCHPCPAGTSSEEGSSKCVGTRQCTLTDYEPKYGTCGTDGKRTRSWSKNAASNCLEGNGAKPSSSQVDCVACPPGLRRKDGSPTSDCVPCADGEYLSTAGACTACPVGSAAVPVLAYRDGFDSLGGIVTKLSGSSMSLRYCREGQATCTSSQGTGFEIMALPISGGDNALMGIRQTHMSDATYSLATFNYTFNAVEDGVVNITLAYVDAYGEYVDHFESRTTLNAHLTVDDEEDYAARTYASRPKGSSSPFLSMVVPFFVDTAISGTQHRLTWVVEELAATSNPISVIIVALEVTGATAGGATMCQPCRPGYKCPAKASAMLPCPPGTAQSAANKGTCDACADGTYSPGYGYRSCIPCGPNMTLSADHTACTYQCAWTQAGGFYNLTDLRGVVLNTSVVPTGGGNATAGLSVKEADDANIARWYFSPCDPLPVPDAATAPAPGPGPVTQDRLCVPERRSRNSSTSAFICQRTTATRGHHFGNAVSHVTFLHPYFITELGSPFLTDNATSPTTPRHPSDMRDTYEAVVSMTCDLNPKSPREGSLRAMSESYGVVLLEWRTRYACPQCTESSYERVETGCEDNATEGAGGTRRVFYTLRANSTECYGGYEPPAPVVLYCAECTSSAYTVRWLECNPGSKTQEGVYVLKDDANCTTGALPAEPLTPRACLPSGRRSGTVIVTLLIILFLVVAALFVLWSYYKRLRDRVARASRAEASELNTYDAGGPDDYAHYTTDEQEGEQGSAAGAGANGSTRNKVSAAASRLWGVVTGMSGHLREPVTLDVVDSDDDTLAVPRTMNGYNRVSNNGDRDAVQRDAAAQPNRFTLADDDDDLLPSDS